MKKITVKQLKALISKWPDDAEVFGSDKDHFYSLVKIGNTDVGPYIQIEEPCSCLKDEE
jgi:hypothetical protein